MSFALTITGNTNILETTYSPAIELNGDYEIGLVLIETFNSIPNITSENNCFYYNTNEVIVIPEGSYELSHIASYLKSKILENKPEGTEFSLTGNTNTQRSEIYCSFNIDFSSAKKNNIGPVLGFSKLLEANTHHESTDRISIIKVNTVQVVCNISRGSYINDKLSHSIYEFGIDVPPGYRISISPNKIIYFPVTVRSLSHISLKFLDQNNRTVDFSNETIVVRLHLQRCQ